jgi:hypothetical protein
MREKNEEKKLFYKFLNLKKLVFHVRGNQLLDESCVDELLDE